MTGLVSFPSYHMTEVVLFTWAGWSVKWLRWPLLALNLVVVVSIPVIGAHYFIDVLGGAVVAIVAIASASYWIQLNSEGSKRIVETEPSREAQAVTE